MGVLVELVLINCYVVICKIKSVKIAVSLIEIFEIVKLK